MKRLLLPTSAAAAALALAPGPAPALAHARSQVVVRFKTSASPQDRAAALQLSGARTVARGAAGTTVVRGPLAALRRRSAVAWASPVLHARAAGFTPNDSGTTAKAARAGGWSAKQWDFTGPFGIRAPEAWDLASAAGAPGGQGVTVAVLDTGVAYADRGPFRRSPDLPAARLRRGRDFVGRDPYPNDENGHGTFVASTIAAAADNGYGMVGVAYRASILPVRVLDRSGEGSSYRVAQGIRYAVDHGARVLNVSIELTDDRGVPVGLTDAPDIRAALRYARSKRAIVVAAAGNSGVPTVPAERDEELAIEVGGTTEDGCAADYSNYGPGLDLVAPGGGEDTYIPADPHCDLSSSGRSILQVTFRRSRPGRFLVPDDYEGTSMAAPHVTGTVALMLAARTLGAAPTIGTVEKHLEATARDLGAEGPDRYYGAGLLDSARALGGAPYAEPAAAPAPSPTGGSSPGGSAAP